MRKAGVISRSPVLRSSDLAGQHFGPGEFAVALGTVGGGKHHPQGPGVAVGGVGVGGNGEGVVDSLAVARVVAVAFLVGHCECRSAAVASFCEVPPAPGRCSSKACVQNWQMCAPVRAPSMRLPAPMDLPLVC